jgi:hypothetical protein
MLLAYLDRRRDACIGVTGFAQELATESGNLEL